MKKQALHILIALTLMTMPAVTRAYGQVPSASKFNVPFDFKIGDKNLPAGSYIVERGPLSNPYQLLIRRVGGGPVAMFDTIAAQARVEPTHSQLVFGRYENTYYLRKVWTAGLSTGRELLKTNKERMPQRELAANAAVPRDLAIAAAPQ